MGSLDKTTKNVGAGLVRARASSDVMKFQIQAEEKGKILESRFKTLGCGSAIASSSVATECVKGKTLEEALTIKNKDTAKEFCLPTPASPP